MTSVVEQVRQFIKENSDEPERDLGDFEKLVEAKPSLWFRTFKSVDAFFQWANDIPADSTKANMEAFLLECEMNAAERAAANAMAKSAGLPSESELEDAINWCECAELKGSLKQVKWARSIASNHATAVATVLACGGKLPTSASWWIDHRDNCSVSLLGLIK